MKVEDAEEYGLGDYVFISKKDFAALEARLKAADELASAASRITVHTTVSSLMELADALAAYNNAGKGVEK